MSRNAGAHSRLVASRAVRKVAENGMSSSRALSEAGIGAIKNARDAAFARSIFLGTVRWYLQLDAMLDILLDKPLQRKNRDVHYLLLTALFQLAKTDIAEHGTVSETVNAVAMTGRKWARGLVNGVLRNYIRQAQEIQQAINNSDYARTSHPEWILNTLKKSWPEDWERITRENNSQAPMALRVNRMKTTTSDYIGALVSANIKVHPSEITANGLLLDSPCNVDDLPGFATGKVSVQDIAPQLAAELMDLHPGQSVLDACAAPGGKTAHMLEMTDGKIRLTAVEKDRDRLQRVNENLERLGLDASVIEGDAGKPETWWDGRHFDRILVDAPCSGTGVIRRHPDIKLLRRPGDVDQLAGQQLAILQALWPLLKPGGKLLYATCSILPQENENLVEKFLAGEDDANELIIDVNYGHSRQHGTQILPGEYMMDGFFYACLQKN